MSKSVLSLLPMHEKFLPPCESEAYRIIPFPQHTRTSLRLQTRPDFTRVAGEARAPGIPPPSRSITYLDKQ
jgi:hypothetical protein